MSKKCHLFLFPLYPFQKKRIEEIEKEENSGFKKILSIFVNILMSVSLFRAVIPRAFFSLPFFHPISAQWGILYAAQPAKHLALTKDEETATTESTSRKIFSHSASEEVTSRLLKLLFTLGYQKNVMMIQEFSGFRNALHFVEQVEVLSEQSAVSYN